MFGEYIIVMWLCSRYDTHTYIYVSFNFFSFKINSSKAIKLFGIKDQRFSNKDLSSFLDLPSGHPEP